MEVRMSVDLIVYLRRESMPTPSAWQKAIRDAGFPIELDTDFDPDTFSGFLPCKISGKVSGFEYCSGSLSNSEANEVGATVGSNFSVTLVTHSDLSEYACSAIAAGVLAKVSNGLLVDTQSGESFASSNALAWVTDQLQEIEKN
jgi:hypothetical protein